MLHEKLLAATPAVRLYNLPNGDCSFEHGLLPNNVPFGIAHCWLQNHIESHEQVPHPAPRVQYVVTLKGTLEFTVTDGSSFLIRPGILLLAEDTRGAGHTWKLMEGDEWLRLYLPIPEGHETHFTPA